MNILVIGNGFDLAHGLPTKYTDFLQFIQAYKTFSLNNCSQPILISANVNNNRDFDSFFLRLRTENGELFREISTERGGAERAIQCGTVRA